MDEMRRIQGENYFTEEKCDLCDATVSKRWSFLKSEHLIERHADKGFVAPARTLYQGEGGVIVGDARFVFVKSRVVR